MGTFVIYVNVDPQTDIMPSTLIFLIKHASMFYLLLKCSHLILCFSDSADLFEEILFDQIVHMSYDIDLSISNFTFDIQMNRHFSVNI